MEFHDLWLSKHQLREITTIIKDKMKQEIKQCDKNKHEYFKVTIPAMLPATAVRIV